MKILLIADFRGDSPGFIFNNARILAKGLERNGHDLCRFSYRERLLGLSPIKSKKWAIKMAKKKTDRLLIKLADHYQPEMVLLVAFKLVDTETMAQLKETLPRSVFVCWYGDPPRDFAPNVAELARYCDWFLATSGGELLLHFKQLGVPHCAFLPNPADRDIEYPRTVEDKWKSSLLFTGKLGHRRHQQDLDRADLIHTLVREKNMTVWGCLDRPRLEGRDYLDALCGAEMALSINACNDVRFYHSDRLTHYLACGAFTLARQVPGSELLFAPGEHLYYFETKEQCLELIERFETDADHRRSIARRGMERAHETVACEKLTRHIVELVENGEFREEWAEIL